MNLIRAYHMAQKPYQFWFFFSQTDLYFCVSACFGTVPLIFREVLCLRKLLGSILDIFVVFKEFYTHNLDWIFALSYFLIWESFISWSPPRAGSRIWVGFPICHSLGGLIFTNGELFQPRSVSLAQNGSVALDWPTWDVSAISWGDLSVQPRKLYLPFHIN